MPNKLPKLLFVMMICASVAIAQTVTGSGTTNSIPVFTGASSIGNSPISVSGSSVGIGTTGPVYRLDVSGGNARVYGTSYTGTGNYAALYLGDGMAGVSALWGAGLRFDVYGPGGNGVLGTNSIDALSISQYSGNVGVGSTNATHKLEISSSETVGSDSTYPLFAAGASGKGVVLGYNSSTDMAEIAGVQTGVAWKGLLINPFGGNVGIGTTNPQAKLEINGNLRFTSDGSVQTTAWTGVLCGGDYAEAVETAENKRVYEPGDVLTISDDAEGKVQKSGEPYATNVAGVYATKPGVIGRRESLAKLSDDIPMAMVGIVPTKVSAENGSIRPGDLLVTSSIKGYAMKGTDRSRLVGAVIGKSMGSLKTGTGVVEVLITLQ